MATTYINKPPGAPVSTIIKAGLLAGTLDILCAFVYFYIKTRKNPLNVLVYVSKVALGKTTFTDTGLQQITGLLVHFAIAMSWTVLFFILYRYIKLMRLNKIITGIVYGLVVWTVMNIVILPLWNNKPFVFNTESATVNALILIVAIGMPLSFMAHRYYSKK
jgi:hypothetical protein